MSKSLMKPEHCKSQQDILSMGLEYLSLSSRSINALTRSGITTIGGVAIKKPHELWALENLGKKSVEEILAAIEKLKISQESNSTSQCPTEPVSSIKHHELSYLAVLTHIENDYETSLLSISEKHDLIVKGILKNRILNPNARMTLEDLAKKYDLTRERVRQIERDGIQRLYKQLCPDCRYFLNNFLDNSNRIHGIVLFPSELIPQHEKGLLLFTALLCQKRNDISLNKVESFWFLGDLDRDLDSIINYIHEEFKPDVAYDESFIKTMFYQCKLVREFDKPTQDYLYVKILASEFVQIYDKYSYGRPRTMLVVETILHKHFPQGICVSDKRDCTRFWEIAEEENLAKYLRKNQTSINSISNDKERFALWGRRTYVSAKEIQKDPVLIAKLSKELKRHLPAKDSVVGIYGFFVSHRQECLDAGIPNEFALYSYMRIFTKHMLSFFKYPIVYHHAAPERLLGAVRIAILEYMRDRGAPVKMDELVVDLGFKAYQIRNTLQTCDKILQCHFNTYIHVDSVKMSSKDKAIFKMNLRQFVKECNADGLGDIRKLYMKMPSLLENIQIPDTHALYDYLSVYYKKLLYLPKYPRVGGLQHRKR